MLNKKLSSKSGFTLIETVLAIVMFGAGATALLGLQGTLTRTVFRSHGIFERIGYIKDLFVEVDKKNPKELKLPYEKKIDYPETTLIYTTAPSKIESTKNLFIAKVKATWPVSIGTAQETFVSFKFEPKVPEQ